MGSTPTQKKPINATCQELFKGVALQKYFFYFLTALIPFVFMVFSVEGLARVENLLPVFGQYMMIYVIALALVLPFKPNLSFLCAVALLFPFLYLLHVWQMHYNDLHDNGLGVLLYIFSLFGVGLGLVLAGTLYKKMGLQNERVKPFALAIILPLFGFVINYLVVCNTLAYCGCFSF
ncbi:MAG: hypothetical protein AB7D43_13900 [Sulfurimonadaceae bacterium]